MVAGRDSAVIYQADLDETGMAVLAGAVAVLHALAALVAGAMAARAARVRRRARIGPYDGGVKARSLALPAGCLHPRVRHLGGAPKAACRSAAP